MANARLKPTVLIALTAGLTLGNVGGNIMPVLLDGFSSRFELSDSQAGLVAAAQLLSTAIVTLLLSSLAARPGRVRMARIGLVVATVGFLGAWIAPSTMLLTITNIVIGAGLGAVFAAATAALSSSPNVDRATTLAVFFSTIVMASLILSVPLVNQFAGETAGFALLAVCCVLGLFFIRNLPELPMSDNLQKGPPLNWLFLIGVALYAVTEQGSWSFTSVLGQENAGLSSDSAALILGIAAIAALGGVPVSAFARITMGSKVALGVLFAVGIIAKALVITSHGPVIFAIACGVWQVCFLGTLVLMLATAGKVDPSGRLVAAAAGATALGTGIGPAVIGVTLDFVGATGLAIGIVVVVTLAAVPILRLAEGRPAKVTLETT